MGIEHTLFIIVTIALIVLIVASIVVLGLAIALMLVLKRLARKAETATDNWSSLALAWGKRIAPVATSGLVAAAMKQWRKSKQRRGQND